jgi:hypothetical protein
MKADPSLVPLPSSQAIRADVQRVVDLPVRRAPGLPRGRA